MTKNKAKNLVNHITYVLDESGSMYDLTTAVVNLFDDQIKNLVETSKKNNQETRVSVFKFATEYNRTPIIECVIYDTDVLRVPSIANLYHPAGGTPMIQGVMDAIQDLHKIPEMFGDHAHMMFVITDGHETERQDGEPLRKLIKDLSDNWTVGCLVPDDECRQNAIRYGFSSENCFIWKQTEEGVKEVNRVMQATTQSFMAARATGQRSMKGGMFTADLSKIDKKEVQKNLEALKFEDFILSDITTKTKAKIPGATKVEIRAFVESVLQLPFVKGKSFYQLQKLEEIQETKAVCVRDKRNGRVYTGDAARELIGLPTGNCGTVKVKPDGVGTYEVFIQSTSINRVLTPGSKFIYLV
jgi:hypothetical protein